MAEATSLKQRTTASNFLKEAIRDFTRYRDTQNPSMRLIRQKLKKLNDAKDDLLNKHYTYSEKSGKDVDLDEMKEWITPLLDEAIVLADEAFVMIEDYEENENITRVAQKTDLAHVEKDQKKRSELLILEKQCENTEKLIGDTITAMLAIINDETKNTKDDKDVARAHLKEIESFMEIQTKSWNELKMLNVDDPGKLNQIFDQEQTLNKFVSERRLLAFAFTEVDKEKHTLATNVGSNNDTNTSDSSTYFKMKMTPPKFSGNIRLFAKFKAFFKSIIEPKHPDKVYQAYILRQDCLSGEAKRIVENITDVDKIWERLHDKYGDHLEIVNTVVKDIQTLSLNNNSDQGFIQLVDTVELGIQHLEVIGAKDEIANAHTVNLLERKLPKRVLSKWFEKEDKKANDDGKVRFEKLLTFLKEERRHTERMIQLKPPGDREDKKKDDDRKRRHIGAGAQGKEGHTFNNKCLIHPNSSHFTRKCHAFLEMSATERGEIVKNSNGCKLCLSISHVGDACPFEGKWKVCGVNGCTQNHSRLIHGCGIPEMSCHTSTNSNPLRNNVLLLIEKVKTATGDEVLAFWDNGSSLALISKDCAKRMNLVGIPVSYDLITVGGVITAQNTVLYEVKFIDRKKQEHVIKAYEITDICGEIEGLNVEGVLHLFPSVMMNEVSRAAGKVEILVGMDYAPLHPVRVAENENLVLYSSQFGTGKILGGSHKNIVSSDYISNAARAIASARVCSVRVRKGVNIGVDFFSAEEFGVQVPPRCNRCKVCKQCKFETHQLSRIEQRELEVIRQNLHLDPVKNRWITSYPYKRDPSVLEDNRHQVIKLLEKKEKKLSTNKVMADEFKAQYQDLIDRKILTEITEKDDSEYDDQRFYVSTHEVYKEGSSSTPIRLVVNPSLKYKGISLNDILMKGPNALNDLFGIQLRFRKHYFAVVADLRKYYQSVQTTEREKHLRRIVWRDMKTSEKVKVYGPETVMFGDRPAAAITSVAIRQTAEIYKHVDELSAQMLQTDLYVDDLTSGVDEKESIERVKQKVPEILSKGGFSVKGFVCSYDDTPETLALLGTGEIGRVLGIHWDPRNDKFAVIAKINVTKKFKGARSQPDIKREEIPRLMAEKLTRRILLSIVMSCYDPLGLLSPITVRLKIELRTLYKGELNLGWDDPISDEMKSVWVKLVQLLKDSEEIRFPRCIKPQNAIGNPELVIFNDGSKEAMCTAAYVRWSLDNGEFECRLWVAKTRVTPLHNTSIPRIEMQSAVMSARLYKAIVYHADMNFNDVHFILDSMCTLALLNKDSLALKEYMGNRVSECLHSVEPSKYYHVKSSDNIADLATRNTALVSDVSEGSVWQTGPDWLRLNVNEWPVTQDVTGATIPSEEILKVNIAAFVMYSLNSIVNLERFKNRTYDFLIRTMAVVIRMLKSKSFKSCVQKNSVEELENSEHALLKLSMSLTSVDLEKGKLKSLRPKIEEDGVIVMEGRALEEFRFHYGTDRFPILTERDTLAHLWMKKVHEENHTGITSTVSKSRRKYWIVRARRLAKKVVRSCYECRLIDKKLAEQQMAPLPRSRLAPSPTFHTVSMDLFGPFLIKDTVKQRTKKKIWGVVFSCTVTRALYIDVTEDYSTDSILQTIRRFISIRGSPSEIQSDQGSQLIAAAKDIAELVENWDWVPIQEWATNNKIKWTLAPAEGQHQNGLSESLIKSVKRTMKHKIGSQVLTFSQIQMVFFEIANIINSRPIGVMTGSDPRHPDAITPNDLILGRATNEVPQGPFDSDKRVSKRFRFLQNLVTEWWHDWYELVLPTLVPSYKWLQRHRNVCVGDICLIRYGKDKRATYRLGRVKEVSKGKDELVRKVKLEYKLPGEKSFRNVERPIHGIAVIVPVEEQLDPHAEEFHPREN